MSARTPVGATGEMWLRPVDAQGRLLDREQRGCRWRAFVYTRDRDGRRRVVQSTGKTRGAAERALDRKLKARQPAGWRGIEPGMTVKELGAYWLDQRKQGSAAPEKGQKRGGPIAPQTLATYRYALEAINEAIGELRLYEVTVGIVDATLLDMERHGRSTGQIRTVLVQMFGLATKHGAIETNPMREVEKPRRAVKEVEALTVVEARQFLALLREYVGSTALDKQGRKSGG